MADPPPIELLDALLRAAPLRRNRPVRAGREIHLAPTEFRLLEHLHGKTRPRFLAW